jgi:ribosome-associated translation inhibitor RaiA
MTRKSSRDSFPQRVSRPVKRRSGRTAAGLTPLHVRARGGEIDRSTREHVSARVERQFGKFALHIERITVRFDQAGGSRDGGTSVCDLKIVLSGRPSVVTEGRAPGQAEAFDRAATSAQRTLVRSLARAGFGAPALPRSRTGMTERLAGGRAGAAAEQAGGRESVSRSKGSRNVKKNMAGLTSALEESEQDRPSRKSTRGSANRAKRDSNLQRRQTRRVSSPKARARRNAVKQK